MKLNVFGEIDGLQGGLELIAKELRIELHSDGIPVEVKRSERIEAGMEDGKAIIRYADKIHFFRAFGLLVEGIQNEETFKLIEDPQFSTIGVMMDVSRNAVLKVESIKHILRKVALMGINMIMLYTEDTYEIKSSPYFGYMRGKYSYDELHDCDMYADNFGIEIIPCIQTLAHLSEALKWDYAKEIRDTNDILLVGDQKTYEFIEDMMKSASAPFRSKRIHIGMDEAHRLGLGKYLDIHGYRMRFDIMNQHLARVREIAGNIGLEPMIWSDMYFRLGSKTGDYYDKQCCIPQNVVNDIPKDVQLVYWDYYHENEEEYRHFLQKHKELGCDTIFAGGIWTWNGMSVNYTKTFKTTNSALNACKKEGICEVFATMWGDNGAETNIFAGLLGMQLFAEHGYAKELDQVKLKKRFKFCTGGDYDAFTSLTALDEVPGSVSENTSVLPNPSKFLLWQDLLLGLFDRHVKDMDLKQYYSGMAKKLEEYLREAGTWSFVFEMPVKLADVLSKKSGMGVKIKESYDRNEINELKNIATMQLPELLEKVKLLREVHRAQWFRTNKPFGWEIIDIRYGGVLARIETAIMRLSDYTSGKVDRLEELEEERLYFDGREGADMLGLGYCNDYKRIISACPI